MNRFGSFFKPLMWSMALLLAVFVAGCGGGSGGGGGGGSGGTDLPSAGTNPTVISSNPSNLATNVPTSTNGRDGMGNEVVTGTLVTATFSEAMDPATITPVGTFTLKETTSGTSVPGAVTMNTANTIATFTPTASALLANTQYTATVTTAAKTTGGTPITKTVAWSFTTGVAFTGQASPNIGTASTYGVFASSAAVTLAANSIVNGDVGLNPAGACNNCVIGTTVIGGVINNGNAAAIQAQTDFGLAYTDASTRASSACTVAGDLSTAQGACNGYTPGPVYRQGLYRSTSTIGLTGTTFTLDAENNPDAVFIFRAATAITTGTSSTVVLVNGAQAKNVWWVAGTAATLGVTSTFKGTVIANTEAITVFNGLDPTPRTLVEGRLFSSGAAVTVQQFATVTVPK